MDSYNRGYGAGIAGLGGVGSQIGNARIVDADLPQGSEFAGFYASAYTLGGKTIISYRGTDNPLGFGDDGSDLLNGWLFGAGVQTSQLTSVVR
jgi:hypothetical protein